MHAWNEVDGVVWLYVRCARRAQPVSGRVHLFYDFFFFVRIKTITVTFSSAKCTHVHTQCGVARSREVAFLDVSLAFDPFNPGRNPKTLAEALKAYVTPDDVGCITCPNCGNTKQPSLKGVAFKTLPYLLNIQVGRGEIGET